MATTGCSAWCDWLARAGFSPEEIRVVESFGQQAGLAIELDRAQNDREAARRHGRPRADRQRPPRPRGPAALRGGHGAAGRLALDRGSGRARTHRRVHRRARRHHPRRAVDHLLARTSDQRQGRDEHACPPLGRDLHGGPGSRVPTPTPVRRPRGHEGPRGARPRRAGGGARGSGQHRPPCQGLSGRGPGGRPRRSDDHRDRQRRGHERQHPIERPGQPASPRRGSGWDDDGGDGGQAGHAVCVGASRFRSEPSRSLGLFGPLDRFDVTARDDVHIDVAVSRQSAAPAGRPTPW